MQIQDDKINVNGSKPAFDPLNKPSPFRYLPLLIWAVLLFLLFNSCNNSRQLKLAIQNKPYIYVQTDDESIVKAKVVAPSYREEGVIRDFVENWLEIAFTWQNQEQKNYFVTERNIDFPLPFYLASLGIKPGYREAFMDGTYQKYDQKFPFHQYISGEYQSYVRTFKDPVVSPVEPGVWDVKIVTTRTHARKNSIIAHEILNRIIRVQAIKPSDDNYLWGEPTTELGRLLNQMQKQGLQVIEITEF